MNHSQLHNIIKEEIQKALLADFILDLTNTATKILNK